MIHRRALVLAVGAALAVLPGCGWLLGPAVGESGDASGSSDQEAAAANVRGSIPALEAYYADTPPTPAPRPTSSGGTTTGSATSGSCRARTVRATAS